MASAKCGVHVLQLKAVEVPDFFQRGQRFYKFDDIETSFAGTFVILRVDPKGHVLYWTSTATQSTDSIDIMYILDTRCGRSAKQPKNADRVKEKLCPSFVPTSSFDSCMMTIVIGNNFVDLKLLTFVAPSPQDAQDWSEAVFKIATNLLSLNGSVMHFLDKAYAKIRYAITDKEIRSREIIDMFASHQADRRKTENALVQAKLSSSKDDTLAVDQVTEEHFFEFYRFLTQRTEVAKIFESIQKQPTNGDNVHIKWKVPVILAEQFVTFLNREQRDPRLNEILYPFYTKRSAMKLIQQYEPSEEYASKGAMTIEGFLRFLLSDDNQVLAEEYFDLRTDDMNEPLAHYYISSSHNTYLVGPQMGGRSSAEMYRQVLLAGCRSIELDCWDGRTGILLGQPVITHGPQALTMVPELPFKDVLEAIAESAFKTSEFPVILSLEVRCSEKNQERIAMLCREVFKEMLLTDPLPSHPLESGVSLPSPAMLRRKVLVKCKCRKSTSGPGSRQASWKMKQGSNFYTDPSGNPSPVPAGSVVSGEEDSTAPVVERIPDQNPPTEMVRASSEGPSTYCAINAVVNDINNDDAGSTRQVDSDDDSESDSSTVPDSTQIRQQKQQKELSKELSALANYCTGARFKSFDEADKRNLGFEICSFNEDKGYELIRKNVTDFVNFNKRQVSRIYPAGVRIASSNYMPTVFWTAGCQMVALNFQTLDTLPMQLNQGLFDMNGRCGYVLKPACMRRRDRHFDPFEDNAVENVVANTVHVLIISGQMLSKARVSTYVEVEMYGIPADTVKRKFRTKTVQYNGINPVYSEIDGRPFEFTKVILPDMASIRFTVYDDGNRSMLGHRILPVAGLRPGYRHIMLRNALGQPLGLAALFVKIVVKDFVPDAHIELVNALLDPISYTSNLQCMINDIADALVNPILHTKRMEQRDQMLNSMIDEEVAAVADPQFAGEKGSMTDMDLHRHVTPRDLPNGVMPQSKSEAQSIQGSCSPRPNLQTLPSVEANLSKADDAPSPTDKGRKVLNLPKQMKFGLHIGAGRSGSSCTTDNYKFSYPTIEGIEKDKKIGKLQKKHEKDLEIVKSRHGKERDILRKKQNRKIMELQSLQSKAVELMMQANEKSIRKSDKSESSMLDDLKAQTEWKREHLRQDQNKEKLQLKEKHDREMRALCSKHWGEEAALVQEAEEAACQLRLAIVDTSFKFNLRTLETLYQRETDEVKKRTAEHRKSECENLLKAGLDKEQFSKQKLEMEKRIISTSVDQRKKLEMNKDNREEEMSKAYEDLKDAIKKNRTMKVDAYAKLYEEKIMKGEIPQDSTKV